jgi:xanthine/CO dehydrogenase XdhC/CoxF family maturation factor
MRVVAFPVRPGRSSAAFDAIVQAYARRESAVLDLARLAPNLFSTGHVEIHPPRTLLAFGAGPELPPLLRVARTLGWFTSVADHREGLLASERVGDADVVSADVQPPPCASSLDSGSMLRS